jgi:hypothetical protein
MNISSNPKSNMDIVEQVNDDDEITALDIASFDFDEDEALIDKILAESDQNDANFEVFDALRDKSRY